MPVPLNVESEFEDASVKPSLLVLASTYPRWVNDPEPAFVHELSRRLLDRFRVTVVCPHAPGALRFEELDGVEVIRYRYAPARYELLVNDGGITTNLRRRPWMMILVPSFILAQAWVAYRLAQRRRIALVHAHWLIPQGLIALFLRRATRDRVPYVVTSHGADLYALRAAPLVWIKRRVANAAAAVTVVSSAMRGAMASVAPEVRKLSVIPMGVDLKHKFAADPDARRTTHQLLFVGRLVEKKGVIHLIRALPLITAQRPDVHLKIAGFGPQMDPLKAAVAELKVEDRVTFLGAVPPSDVADLYRKAALFVAPFVRAKSGDQEGLPVALMEAVACGCPVVAGRVDGLEDIFGTELDDWTVDADDPHQLAEKVLQALHDPLLAQEKAGVLRERVQSRLDWTDIARQYGDVLIEGASRS